MQRLFQIRLGRLGSGLALFAAVLFPLQCCQAAALQGLASVFAEQGDSAMLDLPPCHRAILARTAASDAATAAQTKATGLSRHSNGAPLCCQRWHRSTPAEGGGARPAASALPGISVATERMSPQQRAATTVARFISSSPPDLPARIRFAVLLI